MFKIYKLITPDTNKIFYIGLTKQTLKRRLSKHIQDSSSLKEVNVEKMKIIRSLLLSGLKPIIELIEECGEDQKIAGDREIFYIAEFRKQNFPLTNISDGGDYKVKSPQTIEKMKNSLKKYFQTEAGKEQITRINALNKGKKRSSEEKLHLSRIRKGLKKTEDHKRKISEAHLGKKKPWAGLVSKILCSKQVYCKTTNQVFDSLTEAAIATNMSRPSVATACRKNIEIKGYSFCWLESSSSSEANLA